MKVKSICRHCGKVSKQEPSAKGLIQSCPHCKAIGIFLFDAMEAPAPALKAAPVDLKPKTRPIPKLLKPVKKE